jgi:PPOX class probable F420-dependent enzyme
MADLSSPQRSSDDFSREKYVSFTTFRKDGSAAATPVWWVRLSDGSLAFTTDPTSWKVKRLRANPKCEVRPSNVRGNVAPGAAMRSGSAEIVGAGERYAEVVSALKKKYGLMVTLIEVGGSLKQMLRRNPDADCAVIVTLD